MAVVLNGESDPEVDFFTNLHAACTAYGALPGPGGVLQQDAYLMYGLMGVAKAVREREAMSTHQYNQQIADLRARAGGR